jgi:phage-related minor tail protein
LGGRIEKYRQAKTRLEVTGKDGGAIEVASVRARIADKLSALAGVVSKGAK